MCGVVGVRCCQGSRSCVISWSGERAKLYINGSSLLFFTQERGRDRGKRKRERERERERGSGRGKRKEVEEERGREHTLRTSNFAANSIHEVIGRVGGFFLGSKM